jgi:hypothetical protein
MSIKSVCVCVEMNLHDIQTTLIMHNYYLGSQERIKMHRDMERASNNDV